ncbi:MAG TPA: hypothetical protein VGP05_15110, partial [Pseudonocardia sp.]|nr:hypothetical protein [Pseudonocardia sp.]
MSIEQVPGKPARKYCSAAHRAAGRRLRGGLDDGELDYPAETGRLAVGAAARPAAAPGAGYPSPAAPRPQPPASRPAAGGPPSTEAAWSAEGMAPDRAGPEPRGQGHPGPPPNRPAPTTYGFTGSAADLTDDMIVRSRADRPAMGWRGAVFSASGGRINPGVSEAEAARNVLLRRIRRNLPGAHQIAV